MKTCTRCGEEKPLDAFSRQARGKDGRTSWCKLCVSEYGRRWYQANKERKAAAGKTWRESNPQHREYMNAWYADNREHVAERTRAKKAQDPEFSRRKNARRRALKASVTSSPYSLDQIIERDGDSCALCLWPVNLELKYPDPESKSIDHIRPLIHGGPDILDNVQLAHLTCNISKGARV